MLPKRLTRSYVDHSLFENVSVVPVTLPAMVSQSLPDLRMAVRQSKDLTRRWAWKKRTMAKQGQRTYLWNIIAKNFN